MRAWVRLVTDTGESAGLGPGDINGRLRSAALTIADARISEAHAMVSLRGRELMLLALRGRLAVDGEQRSKVVLREGLRVHLAPDFGVSVDELVLPETVTAIEGDGLPRQHLTTVASLFVHPRPRLVSRYDGSAAAWIWSTGEGCAWGRTATAPCCRPSARQASMPRPCSPRRLASPCRRRAWKRP